MNLIKELEIVKFDPLEIPIINIFDNNQSYLIFEEFPPNNDKFTDYEISNFAQILSELTGVKVIQDDRELFIIFSNEDATINKIIHYLENI